MPVDVDALRPCEDVDVETRLPLVEAGLRVDGVLRTECAGQAVGRFLTNPSDVVYPACIDADEFALTPP